MIGVQLLSAPASEPVTVDEAKTHLRVDYSDDDAYISALISAAREVVEGRLRRSVFQQTWKLTLDQFPYPAGTLTSSPSEKDAYLFPTQYLAQYAIELPRTKVQSVSSIVFTNTDDTDVTLDSSLYFVDTNSEPARIVPSGGSTWPYVSTYRPGSIAATFVAGEWDVDTVPYSIKQAMLLLIGHWYANREAVTVNVAKTLPLAVDALLERWTYYGP